MIIICAIFYFFSASKSRTPRSRPHDCRNACTDWVKQGRLSFCIPYNNVHIVLVLYNRVLKC